MINQAAKAEGRVALQIQNVGFSYPPRRVLEDVSFEVPAGSFCVLLGVNGAGKTTLFSLITRLFLCREGSIRILGYDLQKQARKALAGLGVVFQQPTLDLDLSVLQNLQYFCALHSMAKSEVAPRIDKALAQVELTERAADRVRQLSGGQRRRLELARSLLHQPMMLLADEPTVGLDIHSRQAILRQVRNSCEEQGVGVLWATHLVDEVEPGDHVIVLHKGHIVAQDSAAALVAEAGVENIEQAFNLLTGGRRA